MFLREDGLYGCTRDIHSLENVEFSAKLNSASRSKPASAAYETLIYAELSHHFGPRICS